MTILASKNHYCINKAVLEHPDFSVDEICGHERELAFLTQTEAQQSFELNSRNERKEVMASLQISQTRKDLCLCEIDSWYSGYRRYETPLSEKECVSLCM